MTPRSLVAFANCVLAGLMHFTAAAQPAAAAPAPSPMPAAEQEAAPRSTVTPLRRSSSGGARTMITQSITETPASATPSLPPPAPPPEPPSPPPARAEEPTPEQFARMQDCNMKERHRQSIRRDPGFARAPDCDSRSPAPSTRLSAGHCIERATRIQLQWAQEGRLAAGDVHQGRAAEVRAHQALRDLFQTTCSHHPQAREWLAQSDAVLTGGGSAFANTGGSPGAGRSGGAAPAGRVYYPALNQCIVVRRYRETPSCGSTQCACNQCGQTVELHFSGGMVSIGTGRCFGMGAQAYVNGVCRKNDSYDQGRRMCF